VQVIYRINVKEDYSMADKIIEQGVHHIGMRSCNYEKTVKFYQEGLGFKTVLEWEWGEKWESLYHEYGQRYLYRNR
jgi:catechol-2,3-dioxygenase